MFGVLLQDIRRFIFKKKNPIEDGVDRVSSWLAPSLMFIFCAIAGGNLFIGGPIECTIPANYPSSWSEYVKSWCYINQLTSTDLDENGWDLPVKKVSYYPWMTFFFFAHAFLFLLPKFLWKSISKRLGMDLEHVVHEVKKSIELSVDKREQIFQSLASFITSQLDITYAKSPCFMWSLTAVSFLLKKWLYVLVAVAQFYGICHFLGDGDYLWGYHVAKKSWLENNFEQSSIFPIHSVCTVPEHKDNAVQDHSVFCLLAMNVLYEKIYVFSYFFFAFVAVASTYSAICYTLTFAVPAFRYATIEALLKNMQIVPDHKHQVVNFTNGVLHADGFLALLLIKENYGSYFAEGLLKELWEAF